MLKAASFGIQNRITTYAMPLLLAGLAVAPGPAFASAYQGTVTHVWPLEGKVFVIIESGAYNGAASPCSGTGSAARYAIDPSTAFGKALFATALSAKVTGGLVYASGDGICGTDNLGGSEGLVGLDFKG